MPELPEFSWPWAAAVTATLLALMKGLKGIWTVAQTVGMIHVNSQTALTGITDLQEQFTALNLKNTEKHARIDERMEDAERRIGQIEGDNRA